MPIMTGWPEKALLLKEELLSLENVIRALKFIAVWQRGMLFPLTVGI